MGLNVSLQNASDVSDVVITSMVLAGQFVMKLTRRYQCLIYFCSPRGMDLRQQ